ncbi:GNAT family N-acetyltransferase [Desulfovibrio falkowii]|uniref:GNAT family N-acetyltransferase n=1 Tax=Desulfovibrio falkowii TaxID=3136602 RepID=A0ABQ0E8G6_9BACT
MKAVHRNSCSEGKFKLTPVEDFKIFAGFSCLKAVDTDRDLEEFIREDAERHFYDKIAVTYCLVEETAPTSPIAFVTLQNDAIIVENRDSLPGIDSRYEYKSYPAVKIGRLGVAFEMQRKHMGSLLLHLIIKLMLHANRTGCRFLTVDARRDKVNKEDVRPFYAKCGFSTLECRPKTSKYVPMFFDLSTVR